MMRETAPRIFYVPNEFGGFRQVGFRQPLTRLEEAGLVGEHQVFSLLDAIRSGGRPEGHRQELIRRVRAFRPDILLLQHLGHTGLRGRHFKQLRSIPKMEIIYHEADPYSRLIHPLPAEARTAGRAADVVFTVGSGTFAQNFRRSGSRDVRWVPSAYEPGRSLNFEGPVRVDRPYDVVIVANRNTPRFRGLPNWRDRIRFVELMQARFGDRLAVFGKGWEGSSAKGPTPFEAQDEAITSGWVSANWDHFATERGYFSNRLPISLASGSIHATTDHPGYDELFGPGTDKFLLRGLTPEHLADAVENLLSVSTINERTSAIQAGREFAAAHFRQDELMVDMLNWRRRWINASSAKELFSARGGERS